jgi:hypothetical protein
MTQVQRDGAEMKSKSAGHPRREKREGSFMPVEITGGLGRREGLGEELFWGGWRRGPSAPLRTS